MSVSVSQASKLSLSLCMIVKNEAQNLARCLSSATPHVDEIVVIDTGSEDETVKIAEQFEAQIHSFEWCDDFAVARNYAISQATGPWILMLDADEELIGQSTDWRNQIPTIDVLACTIDLKDADDHSGLTPMRTPRMFLKQPDLYYVGRYHEHLEYQGYPLSPSAIAHLNDLTIVHYGYAAEVLPQKSQLRIPILEKIRQQEGLDLMLLWTLSGMYECVQNPDKVQECYEEAFERLVPHLLSGDQPQDFRSVPSWMYSLGLRLLQAEDIDSLRLLCQRGQEWCSTYPPLSYLTGLLIKGLGFPRGAIPYFESCLQAGQTGQYFKGEPFAPNLTTILPALEVGKIYVDLDQRQDAKVAFELALAFDPVNSQAQEHLALL